MGQSCDGFTLLVLVLGPSGMTTGIVFLVPVTSLTTTTLFGPGSAERITHCVLLLRRLGALALGELPTQDVLVQVVYEEEVTVVLVKNNRETPLPKACHHLREACCVSPPVSVVPEANPDAHASSVLLVIVGDDVLVLGELGL